jgi:hypothetical protein
MNIEAFVDSLIPNGWQDDDSRDAVLSEVETLQNELGDDVLVTEVVSNLFEAFRNEVTIL